MNARTESISPNENLESRLGRLLSILNQSSDTPDTVETLATPFEAIVFPQRNQSFGENQETMIASYDEADAKKWGEENYPLWIAYLKNAKEEQPPCNHWNIRAPAKFMNTTYLKDRVNEIAQNLSKNLIERLSPYIQKDSYAAAQEVDSLKKLLAEKERHFKQLESLEIMTYHDWSKTDEGKKYYKEKRRSTLWIVAAIYGGIDAIIVSELPDVDIVSEKLAAYITTGMMLCIPAGISHFITLKRSVKNRWKNEKSSVQPKREQLLKEYAELTTKLRDAEQFYSTEKEKASLLSNALGRQKKKLGDEICNAARIIEDPHLNDILNAINAEYRLGMKSTPLYIRKGIERIIPGVKDTLTRALYKTKLSFPEEAQGQRVQGA